MTSLQREVADHPHWEGSQARQGFVACLDWWRQRGKEAEHFEKACGHPGAPWAWEHFSRPPNQEVRPSRRMQGGTAHDSLRPESPPQAVEGMLVLVLPLLRTMMMMMGTKGVGPGAL